MDIWDEADEAYARHKEPPIVMYVVKDTQGGTIVSEVMLHDECRQMAKTLNEQYQTDSYQVVEWN